MHQTWLDFATHGDPGWPTYDDARKAMRFDASPHLCEDTAPADLAAGQRRQLRGLAESGLAYVPAPLLPEGRLPG